MVTTVDELPEKFQKNLDSLAGSVTHLSAKLNSAMEMNARTKAELN